MHFPHEHRGSYFTVYRKGDWKLIYYYNPSRDGQPYVKLFRLDEDPFERDDLSDRCPDKVRVLFHEMKKRLEVEGACYPVNQQRQPVFPDWKGK